MATAFCSCRRPSGRRAERRVGPVQVQHPAAHLAAALERRTQLARAKSRPSSSHTGHRRSRTSGGAARAPAQAGRTAPPPPARRRPAGRRCVPDATARPARTCARGSSMISITRSSGHQPTGVNVPGSSTAWWWNELTVRRAPSSACAREPGLITTSCRPYADASAASGSVPGAARCRVVADQVGQVLVQRAAGGHRHHLHAAAHARARAGPCPGPPSSASARTGRGPGRCRSPGASPRPSSPGRRHRRR